MRVVLEQAGPLLKLLEKIGASFFNAPGIFDFDCMDLQSRDCKTHGHAVVVVSFDLGSPVAGAGMNRQKIFAGFYLSAQAREFHLQSLNAVGFLDPEICDSLYGGWPLGEQGDHRQGLHSIRHVIHIDADSLHTVSF